MNAHSPTQAQPKPTGMAQTPTARYSPPAALLAQLVEHFHGKEGVAGSSPAEGLGVCAVVAGDWRVPLVDSGSVGSTL